MTHHVRAKSSESLTLAQSCRVLASRQDGAVSLIVVLVLLIALTLIVLAMGRVGVQEEIVSGNEQRSHKAMEAAEAGLEYGMSWLDDELVGADSEHLYYTTTNPSIPNDCACWPKTLSVPNDVTPGSGETYNVSVTITPQGSGASYTPYTTGPYGCQSTCTTCPIPSDPSNPCLTTIPSPYLQVVSTAFDANDVSVTATVQQYAAKTSSGTAESGGAPPLVINGCLEDGTGNPQIHPCSGGSYSGQAAFVGTEALVAPNCAPDDPDGICPDPRHTTTCPDSSHMPHTELNGGTVTDPLSGTDAAWDSLFPNMSKEEFKDLADYENDLMAAGVMTNAERNFIYIDSVDSRADSASDWGFNSNHWALNLGTGNVPDSEINGGHRCGTTTPRVAEHPVVLYFGNGGNASGYCPKINASTIIWGVVYFEGCADDGNGWGGGHIFGTAAMDSDVEKINSNTAFCCTEKAGGRASDDRIYSTLVRVPGTWNDL